MIAPNVSFSIRTCYQSPLRNTASIYKFTTGLCNSKRLLRECGDDRHVAGLSNSLTHCLLRLCDVSLSTVHLVPSQRKSRIFAVKYIHVRFRTNISFLVPESNDLGRGTNQSRMLESSKMMVTRHNISSIFQRSSSGMEVSIFTSVSLESGTNETEYNILLWCISLLLGDILMLHQRSPSPNSFGHKHQAQN